jgi:hypothetical protein
MGTDTLLRLRALAPNAPGKSKRRGVGHGARGILTLVLALAAPGSASGLPEAGARLARTGTVEQSGTTFRTLSGTHALAVRGDLTITTRALNEARWVGRAELIIYQVIAIDRAAVREAPSRITFDFDLNLLQERIIWIPAEDQHYFILGIDNTKRLYVFKGFLSED